ncbi:MAG: thiamine pyrophosphate-binding protein [Burkholderiales bacterium]
MNYDWSAGVHQALRDAKVSQVGYVPDAGHKHLIELCHADAALRTVVLTTEEEGVGLAAGAWLGGARSALLMQSSGVGNCINALGMVRECRFPLLMIVTMRGEPGETNPWQVPMGRATSAVLAAMGVAVREALQAEDVAPAVAAAARLAFGSHEAVAVLVAQRVIGIKNFEAQTAP